MNEKPSKAPTYPSHPSLTTNGGRHPLLTPAEAATLLRVTRETIWDWCQTKRLRHRKIGRIIRIDPDDLDEFERQRTVDPRF